MRGDKNSAQTLNSAIFVDSGNNRYNQKHNKTQTDERSDTRDDSEFSENGIINIIPKYYHKDVEEPVR